MHTAVAHARRPTGLDRYPDAEVVAENVARDEIGCPQNAGWITMRFPRGGRLLAPWDEMFPEDFPSKAELPDRWHLRGPAGREAQVGSLLIQPAPDPDKPMGSGAAATDEGLRIRD